MLFVRDAEIGVAYPCPVGKALVVGRKAKNASVDVPCASKHVSRRHCELHALEDGRLRVVDTSAHGTFLNGTRLDKDGLARPGDRIVLGHDYALTVEEGPPPSGPKDETATVVSAPPPTGPPVWRSLPKPLPLGTLGGRYRLVRELGRGGMGAVFEAFDEERGERCAVKRLSPDLSSPVVARRFKREALLGAKLGDHPGIVAVLDVGTTPEGDLFYVMEVVDGKSLGKLIVEGLSRREGVRLVALAARAVAHAHERGVVHRDLKPENVLVDGEGRARLIDFGVSKALDEGTGLTATGSMLGTPAFMSPEQIDDAKRAGPPADVYSLGAILYCVLTGEPPFSGHDMPSLLASVRRGRFVPARERDATVDVPLDALASACLARDPARRPASAAALAAALEDWLARG